MPIAVANRIYACIAKEQEVNDGTATYGVRPEVAATA